MTGIDKARVLGPAASARYWHQRVANPWPHLLLILVLVIWAALLIFCAAVMGALLFDCCIGSAPP